MTEPLLELPPEAARARTAIAEAKTVNEAQRVIYAAMVSAMVTFICFLIGYYGTIQQMRVQLDIDTEAIRHLARTDDQSRYESGMNARMDRIETKLDDQSNKVDGIYRLMIEIKK